MTKQAVVDEPVPSLENGNDTDDKSSIWASILRDVKSSTKKAPATKSLVVLGDNESGRTTLVAKLQGNDDPKRGAGLEYHYIDVKDDDRDDTPKLGVWILDGDVACSAPLLKFAIKPETLENTIVILVANMTQPWSLLSTLKKWTTLIEEHIDRLKIDPTRLRELRDHLQYDFQHYIEPNDSSVMLTSSTSSTTIKSGMGGGRVQNSVSSVSLASTTPLSPINGEEQVVIPLADGVLTKSLGIQIIVVITKCDVMSILEKENDYKDESFDFMQHHLRKFCLEYGAALFYTSVKEKKNIDKLYKYIVHKCYGYPFTYSAAIVERDAIFIPAGWDNPKKADILLENLHRLKSTDNYSDVFAKPIVRRPLQRDNEVITAEDDQEFLSRLQSTIHRPVSPVRADENGTPGSTRPPGSVSSQTPSIAAQKSKSSNVSTGDSNRSNEGALANFFNSLLTKKSGGAATPTTAGAPTTQRQTSQSPTTPSSKRLQQHPLTFAVTPPPGRTKTPTSLKTFPSSSNVDSPPKLLSPVVEQQPKIETTSSSHSLTTVRTPVEDSEAVTNLDVTEDKQSNDVLQLENEPNLNVNQQSIEPVTSQHDSVSNTINKSNNETLDSRSRSESLIEDKSSVVQTALTDDSHRRLSNDFSLSSPPQPDGHSNTEHQEISSSKNQSRSTSPVVNDSNKQLDRSPSIDHKSPRLLSSPTLENAQQLNDKEESENRSSTILSPEEAPTYPIQDISLNNNNSEEQQDHSKQSLNSSRRNSAKNSSIPSRPLTPVSNEPQQKEDKTLLSPVNIIQTLPGDDAADLHSENESSKEILHSEQFGRRPSSSDVRQVEVPDENSLTHQSSRSLSTSNVNTSEEEQHDQTLKALSNTNNNQNYLHSPVEMSDDNATLHSTGNINSSSATENHNSLNSPNIDHHPSSLTNRQPDDPIFIDDNLQKSPINETVHSPENSEPTKLIGSPIPESVDTKFDSYENTTAPSMTEEKKIRSRSTSPTIEQEQERSRSPSPTIKQGQDRSRSPSLIAEQKLEESESSLPFDEQKQQRSRSPSPTTEQDRSRPVSPVIKKEQDRSRSPSPTIEKEQDRSRSPSPITEQKHERSQSPSPINEEKQQRSRSPSPTVKQEQERSRPVSPIVEQDHEKSRSPSPTIKKEQDRSRSPSPTIKKEQDRSRSPSPTIKKEQDRSRSPSPITEQKHERSQSPSPINEEKQQRSRSPSPTIKEEQERSRPVSPIVEQDHEQSRSPSPTIKKEQDRSRSPSPITEQKHERSQSPSPINEEKQQRSRSPSPTVKQGQDQSRSPSPITEQTLEQSESPLHFDEEKQQRSRSPSPITEQKHERSQSPSPINEEKQQRSRSPSPTIKQEQERSRPVSPIVEQDHEQSRTSSPTIKKEQDRSRSPSPTIKKEQDRSRSPSPITEQKHERSQSPLPINEEKQQRSRSPSPTVKQGQDRSRSPSPIIEQKHERSQSPSSINEEKQQRSRSPSPTVKQEQDRNRSPSPITEQKLEQSESSLHFDEEKQQRSLSPSPTIKQEQQRSRSPSPTIKEEQHRSRPVSPIAEQDHEPSRTSSANIQQDRRRSRSPSPINEQEQQRSRSPSSTIKQGQEGSRSLSPATEQEKEKSRSPSSTIEQNEERSRSPSPTPEQKHEQSPPKSPITGQNQERNRFSSPNNEHNEQSSPSFSSNMDQNSQNNQSTSVNIEQKQERSRSPSPNAEQNYQRSRSPSPVVQEKEEKSRSPSPVLEQKEQRSRSPSPISQLEQQTNRFTSPTNEQNQQRSRSPSPIGEHKEQRSRSPSPIAEHKEQRSRSPSPIAGHKEQRSRSPSPIAEHKEQRSRSASPKIDQKIERRGSSSSIHEDQRKDSFSVESLENKSNTFASPKLEENKSPRLSIDGNYNAMDHLEEKVATSPMIESKEEDQNRFPSPTNSEKHNQDHENVLTSSTPVTDKNEQLKKSPLSSPLTEKRVEKSLLVRSPTDQQETSIVQNENENKISPLASPSTAPFTENHSSQALKSPVNENVSSSILEKHGTISPISTINPKQRNLSHSSTKHSSVDYHHEHNVAPISIPPVGHQPGITRSQSQSTITRPNTLPFSPNNHDLDGLYTSNDYNDEDEIPDDGEYHHNSAPSTVSVEYRRSSLLNNNSVDQQHTSVDPNDISKRLSIVEKSRVEDNDNNDADSTNSKDT